MQTQPVRTSDQTLWGIDSGHSSVEFSIKNLLFFAVNGCLTGIEGKIVLNTGDICRSSVAATIKATNINTRIRRRDNHLRSADFLEVDRHPEIQFQSTSVDRGRDRDTLLIKGLLTIKGKTCEVTLDVNEIDRSRSPNGEEVNYYTATTEIDRFDFDVTYGRWLIGRKLKIAINVQASRQNDF